MNGHAANSRTGIVQRSLDERGLDVDREGRCLAPLAPHGVDGMPAHERGGVAEPREERFAASFVGQVIHEGDAGCPHLRTAVCRSRNERRHGARSLREELGGGPLAAVPGGGAQIGEVPVVA